MKILPLQPLLLVKTGLEPCFRMWWSLAVVKKAPEPAVSWKLEPCFRMWWWRRLQSQTHTCSRLWMQRKSKQAKSKKQPLIDSK